MILVLSSGTDEESTNQVIDWLIYYKADYRRINGNDLDADSDNEISISLGNDLPGSPTSFKDNRVTDKDISVVWNRKWRFSDFYNSFETPFLAPYQHSKVADHLIKEFYACTRALQVTLEEKQWLTKPPSFRGIAISKFHVLKEAVQFGLQVPTTLITNSKKELTRFLRVEKRIITKSASDIEVIMLEGKGYAHYTVEIKQRDLAKIPEKFFPSFFQVMVEKEYEIRTFFLNDEFYSMAMFSQSDKKTQTDFRQYNFKKPSRSVPYKLPADVESKLLKLMRHLHLNCASIDLIKTNEGEYVFLEINTNGQFGMVSVPCNYHLEERIAKYLNDEDKKTHQARR